MYAENGRHQHFLESEMSGEGRGKKGLLRSLTPFSSMDARPAPPGFSTFRRPLCRLDGRLVL